MDFKRATISNYLMFGTEVENLFISEYAKNAPGDYVKVYLIALMYAKTDKKMESFKKTFGMDEAEVKKAFEYWAELGLVELKQDGESEAIEFVNIREKLFGTPAKKAKTTRSPKVVDTDLSKLFVNIESICGRLLEAKEAETVLDWIKTYGASVDLIEAAYRYCNDQRGSNRFRYVETVVKDWISKGIKTKADVEIYLQENDKQHNFYKSVFNLLGFKRNPTKAEKDIMDSWLKEYEFTLDDVAKACKKTSGISNPSINYVNKVLLNTQNEGSKEEEEKRVKGIKSIEDAYEKIREANFKKAEKAREEIYGKLPELKEVMNELRELNIAITSGLLGGSDLKLEGQRNKQKELIKKKRELLLSSGYKEDALDPIYSCRQCNDTGITDDGRQCNCYYEILNKLNGK